MFNTADPTSFSAPNESPFIAYGIGTILIHTDDACVVTISSPDQTVLFTITGGTQRSHDEQTSLLVSYPLIASLN